jgi:hypothetical protein
MHGNNEATKKNPYKKKRKQAKHLITHLDMKSKILGNRRNSITGENNTSHLEKKLRYEKHKVVSAM